MLACSARERLFVWAYVTSDDGNATQAARDAGYPDAGGIAAKVRAHALMHRTRVQEAIREVSIKEFGTLLPVAVGATRAILQNPKHPDHAAIVKSTLSRLGLAEKTGVDVTVGGEVTVNHTDAALEQLRVLLGLGVPREKLVETFGFSGLERYEKMLAARAPKEIEGEVIGRG